MAFEHKRVALAAVDTGDNSFRITTARVGAELPASIQKIGLLAPPLLLPHPGAYTVISGFRRLDACRRLGWESVETWVTAADCPRLKLAQMAIASNSQQRPLNLIEQSRSLNLLAASLDREADLAQAAAGLGLPRHPAAIAKVRLLTRMPPSIQKALVGGGLSLAMAVVLNRFAPSDAETVNRLFAELGWGLNRQRECLQWIEEIAGREDKTPGEVLGEGRLQARLAEAGRDRGRKSRAVRDYLFERRYPSIARARRDTAARIKALPLGGDVALQPPKDLEDPVFELRLRFRTRLELEAHRRILEALSAHPVMRELTEE